MPNMNAFDHIDFQIADLLRKDGRSSVADLGRHLGLTEGAIRKRLKKLTFAKILKIVGVVDPVKLGYTIDVQIGVHVSPGHVREVAQRLSLLEPVRYVGLVSGSYDVIVAALFQNQDELLDFLTNTVASIPGIIRCETWHMLEVLKRHYDWFPTKESE